MDKPPITLFNLESLVRHLNAALENPQEVIELGAPQDKAPSGNPLLHSVRDRYLESVSKFPLTQIRYDPLVSPGMYRPSTKVDLGHVFVETGLTDTSENYGGRYETLRMKLKDPLQFRNGVWVPKCTVKILQESEEFSEPYIERRDHTPLFSFFGIGLGWKGTDLKGVLPSAWFLNRNVGEYVLQSAEAGSRRE